MVVDSQEKLQVILINWLIDDYFAVKVLIISTKRVCGVAWPVQVWSQRLGSTGLGKYLDGWPSEFWTRYGQIYSDSDDYLKLRASIIGSYTSGRLKNLGDGDKWSSLRLCPLVRGGGLGGVVVRVLASNLWGRRFESQAGRFMLESW